MLTLLRIFFWHGARLPNYGAKWIEPHTWAIVGKWCKLCIYHIQACRFWHFPVSLSQLPAAMPALWFLPYISFTPGVYIFLENAPVGNVYQHATLGCLVRGGQHPGIRCWTGEHPPTSCCKRVVLGTSLFPSCMSRGWLATEPIRFNWAKDDGTFGNIFTYAMKGWKDFCFFCTTHCHGQDACKVAWIGIARPNSEVMRSAVIKRMTGMLQTLQRIVLLK